MKKKEKINLRRLEEAGELEGKKVIVRVDFNVSISSDGFVSEDFRILRSQKTIDFLLENKAKVILISHIDKKEGGSLEPVARYLISKYPTLRFITDIFSPEARREVGELKNGNILLLENLRKWEGEESNDLEFSRNLASYGDIFVNDAFAVSHRRHASIITLPTLLPSYAGILLQEEIINLSKVFIPRHPFLFIIGGAKFDTKMPIVKKFISIADDLYIGGALANDIFKAKGFFVGDSTVSENEVDLSRVVESEKVKYPIDVITQHKGEIFKKDLSAISVGEKIVDMGEKSLFELVSLIDKSTLIVWNGPLGKNESGFEKTSENIATAISESGAISIVGGGDTLSVIEKLNIFDKFTFVSTGGGAMLDFLVFETLPGIDAVCQSNCSKIENKKTSWIKKIFGK